MVCETPAAKQPKATVVGAGVIGLTTAVLLQRNGFRVTVVARDFPGVLSVEYTSPWAGAHWRSTADANDLRLQGFERVAFETFRDLVDVEEAGVKMVRHVELWDLGHADVGPQGRPWFADFVPKWRELGKDELPSGCERGVEYQTVVINTKTYLRFLLSAFRSAGGSTRTRALEDISEAFDDDVDVVVNCTGIGAQRLGGVADQNCYPTRGQTVLVHAPKVNVTITRHGPHGFNYIIPRGDGTVVLGGTYQKNNMLSTPDPATAREILQRNLALCPELAVVDKKDASGSEEIDRIKVLSHCVGMRPTRNGGIRIETEERYTPKGNRIILCHHYGHAGYGYQSSWGSANEVLSVISKREEFDATVTERLPNPRGRI